MTTLAANSQIGKTTGYSKRASATLLHCRGHSWPEQIHVYRLYALLGCRGAKPQLVDKGVWVGARLQGHNVYM